MRSVEQPSITNDTYLTRTARAEEVMLQADLNWEIKRNPAGVPTAVLVERIQFSPDEIIRLAATELGSRAKNIDAQTE